MRIGCQFKSSHNNIFFFQVLTRWLLAMPLSWWLCSKVTLLSPLKLPGIHSYLPPLDSAISCSCPTAAARHSHLSRAWLTMYCLHMQGGKRKRERHKHPQTCTHSLVIEGDIHQAIRQITRQARVVITDWRRAQLTLVSLLTALLLYVYICESDKKCNAVWLKLYTLLTLLKRNTKPGFTRLIDSQWFCEMDFMFFFYVYMQHMYSYLKELELTFVVPSPQK